MLPAAVRAADSVFYNRSGKCLPPVIRFLSVCYTLCEHCLGNLFKACNVSAGKQIAL